MWESFVDVVSSPTSTKSTAENRADGKHVLEHFDFLREYLEWGY